MYIFITLCILSYTLVLDVRLLKVEQRLLHFLPPESRRLRITRANYIVQ